MKANVDGLVSSLNFLKSYFPAAAMVKAFVDFCVALKFLLRLGRNLDLTPDQIRLKEVLVKEGHRKHWVELAIEKMMFERQTSRVRKSSTGSTDEKEGTPVFGPPVTIEDQASWMRTCLSTAKGLMAEFRDENMVLSALVLADNDVEKAYKILSTAFSPPS
jgi:hypothetical protein